MRYLILIAGLAALAACNSASNARKEADQEYAVGSYEQSMKAYQLCAEQNPGNPEKCSALSRVMDADRKRYDKEAPGF
ncbi:hypothetical protein ACNHKD_15110 [Methylocystis sp. JAN1]|uniref:hypothetical protein n=1 Tax=Methylocystis sp. JAN1 TaxID=3397211 RepID=UPI003FA30C53